MCISHSVLLRMRNDAEKFVDKNTFYYSKKCVISEKMGEKMVEPDRPQVTI